MPIPPLLIRDADVEPPPAEIPTARRGAGEVGSGDTRDTSGSVGAT